MVHAFGRAGLRVDTEILGPAVSTLAYAPAQENRKSQLACWRPVFAVIISYVLTTSGPMRLESLACGLIPRFLARQFRHWPMLQHRKIENRNWPAGGPFSLSLSRTCSPHHGPCVWKGRLAGWYRNFRPGGFDIGLWHSTGKSKIATGLLEARFRCHYLVRAYHIMVHAFGRAGLRVDTEILGPAVSTLAYGTAQENRKPQLGRWRADFAAIISYMATTWRSMHRGPMLWAWNGRFRSPKFNAGQCSVMNACISWCSETPFLWHNVV
jgi:hypothetical protein